MYYEVLQVEYLEDYRIRLVFNDCCAGLFDLSDHANPENVFCKFLDMSYFRGFRIQFGTLVWGEGELDIGPEHLYQLALGKEVDLAAELSAI